MSKFVTSTKTLASNYPPDCIIPHLENNVYIYGGPVPNITPLPKYTASTFYDSSKYKRSTFQDFQYTKYKPLNSRTKSTSAVNFPNLYSQLTPSQVCKKNYSLNTNGKADVSNKYPQQKFENSAVNDPFLFVTDSVIPSESFQPSVRSKSLLSKTEKFDCYDNNSENERNDFEKNSQSSISSKASENIQREIKSSSASLGEKGISWNMSKNNERREIKSSSASLGEKGTNSNVSKKNERREIKSASGSLGEKGISLNLSKNFEGSGISNIFGNQDSEGNVLSTGFERKMSRESSRKEVSLRDEEKIGFRAKDSFCANSEKMFGKEERVWKDNKSEDGAHGYGNHKIVRKNDRKEDGAVCEYEKEKKVKGCDRKKKYWKEEEDENIIMVGKNNYVGAESNGKEERVRKNENLGGNNKKVIGKEKGLIKVGRNDSFSVKGDRKSEGMKVENKNSFNRNGDKKSVKDDQKDFEIYKVLRKSGKNSERSSKSIKEFTDRSFSRDDDSEFSLKGEYKKQKDLIEDFHREKLKREHLQATSKNPKFTKQHTSKNNPLKNSSNHTETHKFSQKNLSNQSFSSKISLKNHNQTFSSSKSSPIYTHSTPILSRSFSHYPQSGSLSRKFHDFHYLNSTFTHKVKSMDHQSYTYLCPSKSLKAFPRFHI